MNNLRFPDALLSYVLLCALAGATMINAHVQPQTVAAAEWAAAVGGVLAFCMSLLGRESFQVRLSLAPVVIVLLMLVCLVWQIWMPGAGYAVYLGLLLLCVLMAARVGTEWLARAVAGGFLACALLQSLAGLAQLSGWTAGGLIMQKIYLQAFGNIGQANHYADLVFLGLAGFCYLLAQVRTNVGLTTVAALPVLAWLALAGAASASRGTLLYTAAFLVLGLMALWRGQAQGRRMGALLLVVMVLSVVAQLLVTYGHILTAFGVTTALDRAGDAGSNGQRLYNWLAAWQAIKAHPWLGEGPATFYKASVDAMFTTPPMNFPKFAEHAHNLPLNMAAELGLPVTVIALLGLFAWYLRHLFSQLTAPRLFALACVGVVGLHSMVEYPLWYTYFLVPVGLCIGIADAEDARLPLLNLPRFVVAGLAVLAVVGVAWTAHDWLRVRSAYNALAEGEPDTTMPMRARARAELASVSRYSVFAAQAESLSIQSWQPDEGQPARIADRCDAHWQYKPGWYMMMRCAESYAETGRGESLQRIAVALCDGFPGYRRELNEWAHDYDEEGQAGLKLAGHACLK